MKVRRIPIIRGDGPVNITIPLSPNGNPITTAAWLADDGAGYGLRMQIRQSDSDRAHVVSELEPEHMTVRDYLGALSVQVSIPAHVTAKMSTGAAADIELTRSDERVDTLLKIIFDVTRDVTRDDT